MGISLFQRSTLRTACLLGFAFTALAALSTAPASAQLDTGSGLRAKLYGASVNSIIGGDFDSATGYGFGLEYRASRRLGFELTSFTSKVESQIDFDFFGIFQIGLDTELQVTPVLGQLDFHMTPDHTVDLHGGPVIGWVRYGDLKTQVSSHVFGDDSVETERVRTKDAFAWGAHLDFDVPFGKSGSFFTAGATYLSAAVKAAPGQTEEGESDTILHLDPLVLKVGVGYRF
jgi:outer membrane protein W